MLAMFGLATAFLSEPIGNGQRQSINEIDFTPKQPPIPKGCKLYWFSSNGEYESFNYIPVRTPDYVIYTTIASKEEIAIKKFNKFISKQN